MESRTFVDRLLAAAGGGRVLVVGDDVHGLVPVFRQRAVEAERVAFNDGGGARLPYLDRSFDLVCVEGAFDALAADRATAARDEVRRVVRRAAVIRSSVLARDAVEQAWLAAGWRKHPLHQVLVPYEGLDWECEGTVALVEPVPEDAVAGRHPDELAAGRDLHMDMLREAGRRADAHVARYTFARQFIRPRDRVLDAACGLGYGSAILVDATLAESVVGVDNDPAAIAYAARHYGAARRRVSFDVRDLARPLGWPAGSFDAIVSFETLEHLPDPDAFLAECRRLLTPAGRIICSVPDRWVDERGVDPNPYHLQVFDRDRLEQDCRRHFLIEHVHGQTAGGGMKLPAAGRRLWPAAAADRSAEWWLLVGMKDPEPEALYPFRHGLAAGEVSDATNVLAFERDYANPWLVRAMVTIGLRTESPDLLASLAARTLADSHAASADAGAALCVQAYRCLEAHTAMPDGLREGIARYVALDSGVPHAWRWRVSLSYVSGLSSLQQGQWREACRAFEACASADASRFSPLLATKTVGAAFLRGWIAVQAGEVDLARRWWTRGLTEAERVLRLPWDNMLLNRHTPVLFGLREAALIVDLASQCAAGLSLSSHAAERPGLVAAELFRSLAGRLAKAAPLAGSAPAVPPVASAIAWSLLDHLGDAHLRTGAVDHVARWEVALDGPPEPALLLHPPSVLEVPIGTGAAGRLVTAVAIHPDAWGRPGSGPCAFSIAADDTGTMTVVLDPHAHAAHRRWIGLSLDVPASDAGVHHVSFETRALGGAAFGWALFRDPAFVEQPPAGGAGARPGLGAMPQVA